MECEQKLDIFLSIRGSFLPPYDTFLNVFPVQHYRSYSKSLHMCLAMFTGQVVQICTQLVHDFDIQTICHSRPNFLR